MNKTTNGKPHIKAPMQTVQPYQRPGTIAITPSEPIIPAKPLPKRKDFLLRHDIKPLFQYTARAWAHMIWLVDNCPTELGWVGAVEQVNQLHYIVHDLRVMDQEAGPCTFEFEDWNKPVTEMLVSGTMCVGRADANLGHSHVNMSVTPSGTDEEQMMDMGNMDEDTNKPRAKFSIQTIVNKRGDHHCAIFDWEHRKHYNDVPYEIIQYQIPDDELEDLKEQLTRVKTYTYTAPVHRTWPHNTGKHSSMPYQANLGLGLYGGDVEGETWPVSYSDFGEHDNDNPEWDEAAWELWSTTQMDEEEISLNQVKRNKEFFKTHKDWDKEAKDDWSNGYSEAVVEHRFRQRLLLTEAKT